MLESVHPSAPLVSVIIPVFNRVIYLGETIESVLAQTYPTWELIIVDDGSLEDVQGCVERFVDGRIRFLRQDNQGNAAARNRGAVEAQGEFLAFLDSDDLWQPEMLATCLAAFAADPDTAVVNAETRTIDHEGRVLSGGAQRNTTPSPLLEALLMGLPVLPSATVVRHDCFDAVGGFAPGLDDWDLWLRMALQGFEFTFLDNLLVDYRIHPENLHHHYKQRQVVHFAILDRFFARSDLPQHVRAQRNRVYARQYQNFCVKAFQSCDVEAGQDFFWQAACLDSATVLDRDLFWALAFATRPQWENRPLRRGELEQGEKYLKQCLGYVFKRPDVLPVLMGLRRQSETLMVLVLASICYGHLNDYRLAQRYLWRTVRITPSAALQQPWQQLLVRSSARSLIAARARMFGAGRHGNGMQAHEPPRGDQSQYATSGQEEV